MEKQVKKNDKTNHELCNIDNVSNCCKHCNSKRVTVGEGGLWCEDCGKLTKKK